MGIHELSTPQKASSDLIYDTLQAASKACREKKYTAVAVAMYSDDEVWTRFRIDEDGTHTKLMGTIKWLEEKILTSWKK